MAETQPRLHPAFLRLSAMISHYFTKRLLLGLTLCFSSQLAATTNSRQNRAYRVDGLPRASRRTSGAQFAELDAIPLTRCRFLILAACGSSSMFFRVDNPRWIKWLAIAIAVLTAAQVFLTIVLAAFTWRLEVLTDSLVASRRSAQLPSPTPELSLMPTPTEAPVPRAVPVATPTLTPSPSPQPARVPHRTHPRRHR